MRERLELRVPEEHASVHLARDEGIVLGRPLLPELELAVVRKLLLEVGSERYQQIAAIARDMFAQGELFFYGWDIRRSYSRQEVTEAECFQLIPAACFEPPGELCGTVYDYSRSCGVCGAGRIQTTLLSLDLRKLPRTKDIASSIASELVVSERLAELLVDSGMTGFELRPVRHKARYEDDAYDISRYPSGRELFRLGEEAGLEPRSGQFYGWLNRPEQAHLLAEVTRERIADSELRAARLPRRWPQWFQLAATHSGVYVSDLTLFGEAPMREGAVDHYRCPSGHVLGLNLLSELYLERESWAGDDFTVTCQLVGCRRGVLVPHPLLVISPRMYRLLHENKVRGFRAEIAYLV